MGFTLCATRRTMIHLLQHDIECERAYKVNEARRPNIVDHIKNGDIDFIINTPGSHDAPGGRHHHPFLRHCRQNLLLHQPGFRAGLRECH